MGNYMGTCIERKQTEEKQQQQKETEQQGGKITSGGRMSSTKESGIRVKLVLTKDELEWLLFQLKAKEGKRLEDVLEEIEKSRSGSGRGVVVGGWKPSLESIKESPEVFDMDRS